MRILSGLTVAVLVFPSFSATAEGGTRGARKAKEAASAPAGEVGTRELQGLFGEALGPESELDRTLGGAYAIPFSEPTLQVIQRGVYQITLQDTGTEWEETFLIGVPKQPLQPAPVLVVFHAYGRTPLSILSDTEYFEICRRKGWYVIAPLGAHTYNFGVPYAQQNVEAVLDWAFQNLYLDLDRLYGVGFSMGGGMAVSYAARHMDPGKPRFAAVVNHTGTVSLRDEYYSANNTSLLEHPQMFGGSPAEYPFRYARISAIDLDPFTGTVNQSNDMARNLADGDVRNWAVSGDPLHYLVTQTSRLHEQLQLRGAASTLSIGAGSVHNWATLDEHSVLDYLSQRRLRVTLPATWNHTLAESNGRWHHFDLVQRQDDAFTSYSWMFEPVPNRVVVQDAVNVARLSFHLDDLSLDASRPVEIRIEADAPGPISMQVAGFSWLPGRVLRDGAPTPYWSYDSSTGSVYFVDLDPSESRTWTIIP